VLNVGVPLTKCSLACLYVCLSCYLYSSINCHCCMSCCDISQQCSRHTSTPKCLCFPSHEFCALLRSYISCHFKHCIVNCIVRNMARIMFCSLAVADPRVGHTVQMHFLNLSLSSVTLIDFHWESCPRLGVVHPGRVWSMASPRGGLGWTCPPHFC